MDYDLKANITTILSFVLLPILAGLGVDSMTGMAIAGVVATLVFYALLYFNEKYLSGFFTKYSSNSTVGSNFNATECTCEEDLNPEYYSEGA